MTAVGAIPSRDSVECRLQGRHRDSRPVRSAVRRLKGSSAQKTSSTCFSAGVPSAGVRPSVQDQVTSHEEYFRQTHVLIPIHSVYCQFWTRGFPHNPRSYLTRTTTRAATGTSCSTVSLRPAPPSHHPICILPPLCSPGPVFHAPHAGSTLFIRTLVAIQHAKDDTVTWHSVSCQFCGVLSSSYVSRNCTVRAE